MKWLKLETNIFENRKIKSLERLPNGSAVVLAWIKILALAGRCEDGGYISIADGVPYTMEELADELRMTPEDCGRALAAMERLKMIDTSGGALCVVGWEDHQRNEADEQIREYNRQKQAEYRARKKKDFDASKNVNDNVNDKMQNVIDCQCKEEEKEKEKEEDIHSIVPRACDEPTEAKWKRQILIGGKIGQGLVMLSEEQIDDLLERLSLEEFDRYCGVIAECEKNGKHYKKPHYKAILEMAEKDRRLAT